MSIHHLRNAHMAIAQIDKLHTNSAPENITMNHKTTAKTHIILNKHQECSFSFVNELIIHEIQAKTSTIHKIISINVQYTPGAHIVIIQHKISRNAKDAINHIGQVFLSFVSTLA
jgi:hypothetical protein